MNLPAEEFRKDLPLGVGPKIVLPEGKINTSETVINENVRRNIKRALPQVPVYGETARPMCIVGGGWSLDDTFEELRELVWDGAAILALNGAANWLVERNIRPGAVFILDAQAINHRFIEKEIPDCKYFLASQCDPSLFDTCEGRELYICHTGLIDSKIAEEVDKFYAGRVAHLVGGCTVGTRALTLVHRLGFRFLHLFGFDSCYNTEGKHHAYDQPWNDTDGSMEVWCAGRVFRCSAWQAGQGEDFQKYVQANGDEMHLHVHGDGLLAHFMVTGDKLERGKLLEEG